MPQNAECPRCRQLESEVQRLKAQVNKLEEELRKVNRQATRFPRNKRKSRPKKPGRRKGQGKFNYRQPPSDDQIRETVHVPLHGCPECGRDLEDQQRHETIQTDIPVPEPVHTRYVTESGYCPCCKKRFHSRHAEQVSTAGGAAGVCLGPNVKALGAEMKHGLGVSYAKIADFMKVALGVDVTPSCICQSNERLAQKAEPVYKELVEAIRESCAVHADETGWRVGVLSAWLWVFTNHSTTVYTIEARRGHEVVVEILGRQFPGVLHADCFKAYDHQALSDWLQQKCFAHFLKDLAKMEEEKSGAAVCFARDVAAVLRKALELRDRKEKLSEQAFQRRLRRLERELDKLIDATRNFSDPDNRRFAKRLRKQRRHLFRFLTHDGVAPTNNRAERQLRPAVILRKIGGCNKTKRGAKTHAVLASIFQTAKQRGLDVFDYVKAILTAEGRPPPLPNRS